MFNVSSFWTHQLIIQRLQQARFITTREIRGLKTLLIVTLGMECVVSANSWANMSFLQQVPLKCLRCHRVHSHCWILRTVWRSMCQFHSFILKTYYRKYLVSNTLLYSHIYDIWQRKWALNSTHRSCNTRPLLFSRNMLQNKYACCQLLK